MTPMAVRRIIKSLCVNFDTEGVNSYLLIVIRSSRFVFRIDDEPLTMNCVIRVSEQLKDCREGRQEHIQCRA